MSQLVFNDIDPNTKSGTDLATDLNNFKLSLLTQHSGTTAPTYIEVGTQWLDSSVTDQLTLRIYDGAQNISVYTIDTAAHTISYGGNNPTASFTIARTDNAADMLELYRNTQLQTSAGIIFTQRNDAAVKKTMANVKMESDSIANGNEDASFVFEGMKAGTLTELMRVDKTKMFFDFLIGTGKRQLVADSLGNVSAEAVQSGSNLLGNGNADSGDDTQYTATGITFTKSTTAADLIEGSSVFRAVSSAAAETLVSEDVTLLNNHIDHPMVLKLKYKCSTDWTIELLDQANATLVSETLNAFVPVANEANNKNMFVVIPSGTTVVKMRLTSSAADTLLFDDVVIESIASNDQELYFERELSNNQVATNLFDIARIKNKLYKVEARIARETDTNYAESVVEFYISYDQSGAVWRIAKESVQELESVETNTSFTMSTTNLQYATDDITGTNYTGKINGKIKRIL